MRRRGRRLLGSVGVAALGSLVVCVGITLGIALPQRGLRLASAAVPAKADLKLKLERTFEVGSRTVALAGGPVRVRGTVSSYVPDQYVTVRLYRHGRKLLAKKLKVRSVKGGERGTFVFSFRSRESSRITVRASHRSTEAQKTMVASSHSVDFLRSTLSVGSRGLPVRVLQRRLAQLHYAVSRSGVYDDATARAVLAYRKVNGMTRTTDVSKTIFKRLLRRHGAFKVRYPRHGRHVEADLSRQVMALINGRKVYRTYHISSGAPVTPTVTGHFRVYMKAPGTNAKGMVHSSFFIRGYAVHGFASVPIYPASHGCLRVPVPDALLIFNWIRSGNRVDVYQ